MRRIRSLNYGYYWIAENAGLISVALDRNRNLPGHLDFSYRIAFSTTPIDSSVFLPPAVSVPEHSTLALMLIGLAGALVRKNVGSGLLRPVPG